MFDFFENSFDCSFHPFSDPFVESYDASQDNNIPPELLEMYLHFDMSDSNSNESNKRHDKNSDDNLLRKIHLHFFDFIVLFMNNILQIFKFKQEFLLLDPKYKENVNHKFVNDLKQSQIKEIIVQKIRKKYKKKPLNTNEEIYKKIKDNEIIDKILSINILDLFKLYYKSNKNINLEQFGINKSFTLSDKVKMFKDLLIKNKSKGELHIKNIQRCAVKNYLPNYIFITTNIKFLDI